jgi:UDP-N-acetylmuramate--alanine ligase
VLVIDDYGHHPTEIAAVLAAARTLGRRIIVAFQPHRFSRTAALKDAFGPSLAEADHLVLTDIYAAGEDPIPGVTIDSLAAAIRGQTQRAVDVVPALKDVAPALARIARPGDMVITLGAGSISSVGEPLIELLSQADRSSADGKEPR